MFIRPLPGKPGRQTPLAQLSPVREGAGGAAPLQPRQGLGSAAGMCSAQPRAVGLGLPAICSCTCTNIDLVKEKKKKSIVFLFSERRVTDMKTVQT